MRCLIYYKYYSTLVIGLLYVGLLTSCSVNMASGIKKPPTYIYSDTQEIGEIPSYKIQVGDILEVKFLYNEEFNQEIIVRPDGVISTAAVQSVKASGRTPSEVASELTKKYMVHLKAPNLSVLVKSYAPTRIYVLGEVGEPGEYESLMPNPSLLQILARAGDIKTSAEGKQILIIRKHEVKQPTFFLTSYDDVVSGKNISADIQLTSNDIIFVPRSAISSAQSVYQQYVRDFIPTSFGVGYSL